VHVEPHTLTCAAGGALALMLAACAPPAAAQESAPPPVSPRVEEAIAYEHGEGVSKDPQRAAELYCEAARTGDAEALFNLGWMYANGRGIGRDYDIAASLFARAAAAGHAQAIKVLPLFHNGQPKLPECLTAPAATLEAMAFDITPAGKDPFADLPGWKQKIADMVVQVAPSYGIEPRLALAVITVESNFDAFARSEKDARGLMQLIPETAARFRVRNAFDARDNVRGGLSYLRWLLAYYRGEVVLAAAAYNAGEAAVDRYRGVPPYAETRDYVKRVMRLFPRERHSYDPSVASPSPVVLTVKRPGQALP
jgi:soluble lytic murein transglycosylase-like protein